MDIPEQHIDFIREILAVLVGGWLLVSVPWVAATLLGCAGFEVGLCTIQKLLFFAVDVVLAVGLWRWLRRRYQSGRMFMSHWAIKVLAAVVALIVVVYFIVVVYSLAPSAVVESYYDEQDDPGRLHILTVCQELVAKVNTTYCNVRQDPTMGSGPDGCVNKTGPVSAVDGLATGNASHPTGSELGCNWVESDDFTIVNITGGGDGGDAIKIKSTSGEMRNKHAVAIVESTAYGGTVFNCVASGYVDQDAFCPIE